MNNTLFSLVKGSIIDQDVDIIVNAANAALINGAGINGAIHAKAGPELAEYLKTYYPSDLTPGDLAVSPGFGLSQTIFHAPGPIWSGGDNGEPEHLANLYSNIMDAAESLGANSIAFCSISTGIYGYPLADACLLATKTIFDWIDSNKNGIEKVVFAMYGDAEYQAYLKELLKFSYSHKVRI